MTKKKIAGIILFIAAFFGVLCWYSYSHITGADIGFIAKLDEAEYTTFPRAISARMLLSTVLLPTMKKGIIFTLTTAILLMCGLKTAQCLSP